MLKDPRLSTYICLSRGYHVQELLQTSGSELPLHIYAPKRFYNFADLDHGRRSLRLIMEGFERVERAKLTLFPPPLEHDVTADASELSQSRVSRLQSMEFIVYGPNTTLWCSIPPLFPTFKFPHLAELSCTRCNFGCLSTLLVPTLRRLKLVNISRMRAVHLVEHLRPLCLLEELVLEDVLTGIPEVLDSDYQQAYFPKLRQLAIQDVYATLASLISFATSNTHQQQIYPYCITTPVFYRTIVINSSSPF